LSFSPLIDRGANDMPKAVKERRKHSVSLSTQLQNDKEPLVSESKRARHKRKAGEDKETAENGNQVIDAKLSRQILTMARKQLDEVEDAESSEEDSEWQWRESQL
jgi:hypothetical protein